MFGGSIGSLAAREAAAESGMTALRLLSQLTDEQLETLDSAMGCLPITVREEIARYRKAAGPGLVVGRLMDWNVPAMNNEDYRTLCFGIVLSQRVMQRLTVDALTSLIRMASPETLRFYRKGGDMEEVTIPPVSTSYPFVKDFSPEKVPQEVYEKEGWWIFDYLVTDSKAKYDTQVGAVMIAAIGAELSIPFNSARRIVYAALAQVHDAFAWKQGVMSNVMVVSAGAMAFWFGVARQAQSQAVYSEAIDVWERFTKPEALQQVHSMYETGGPYAAEADNQLLVGSYMSGQEQGTPLAEPETGFLPGLVSGLFSMGKKALSKGLKKMRGIKKAKGLQLGKMKSLLKKRSRRRKRARAAQRAERTRGLPGEEPSLGTIVGPRRAMVGGVDDEYESIAASDVGNVVVSDEEGDAIGYADPRTVAESQDDL